MADLSCFQCHGFHVVQHRGSHYCINGNKIIKSSSSSFPTEALPAQRPKSSSPFNYIFLFFLFRILKPALIFRHLACKFPTMQWMSWCNQCKFCSLDCAPVALSFYLILSVWNYSEGRFLFLESVSVFCYHLGGQRLIITLKMTQILCHFFLFHVAEVWE